MFEIPQLWLRILGIVIFAIALAFFVNPMLLGIRNAGCYSGTIVSILGIVYFAANPWTARLLKKIWDNGMGHILLCVVLGVMAVCCLLAIIISGCMIGTILDKPKEENTVVILGCKVRGTKPSLMLQRRLDAALVYLEEHPDVPVIVCGGQGPDESMTEAACMADYLQSHGISEERIFQDNKSTSTQENLSNAKEIIEAHEWSDSIILVTDGYHQFRASLIAKNINFRTDAISAPTSWYLVPAYWVREWLGVCHFFVFG